MKDDFGINHAIWSHADFGAYALAAIAFGHNINAPLHKEEEKIMTATVTQKSNNLTEIKTQLTGATMAVERRPGNSFAHIWVGGTAGPISQSVQAKDLHELSDALLDIAVEMDNEEITRKAAAAHAAAMELAKKEEAARKAKEKAALELTEADLFIGAIVYFPIAGIYERRVVTLDKSEGYDRACFIDPRDGSSGAKTTWHDRTRMAILCKYMKQSALPPVAKIV